MMKNLYRVCNKPCASARENDGKHRKRAYVRAFTLLELLLALGLLVVLLGVLWNTVAIFTQSQHRGLRLAERSQLVRSLSQLLQDDLNAAIQDPIRPQREIPGADDDIRRFGLSGTSQSLRVDVVAMNPFAEHEVAREPAKTYNEFVPSEMFPADDSSSRPGGEETPLYAALGEVSARPRRAAELKTVFYEFNVQPSATAPAMSRLGDAIGYGVGLSRREIDFETPDINARGVTGSYMTAPEVVDCRFRYFDGSHWSDSWESLERGGLPIAVEVIMTLLPLSEAMQLYRYVQTTRGTPETSSLFADGFDGDLLFPSPEMETKQSPADISVTEIVQKLGLSTPVTQRVVADLPTSPIRKFEQYEREKPKKTDLIPVVALPPSASVPVPAEPPPPSPAGPQKSWIRQR